MTKIGKAVAREKNAGWKDCLPRCGTCNDHWYGEEYDMGEFAPCEECYAPLHEGECYSQHYAHHCEVLIGEDIRALARWREGTLGWALVSPDEDRHGAHE